MSTLLRSRQRGLTLVEVLVTVVIAAFGVLGVAGLLVQGASRANTSYARTVVTQKIYALADLMRANPAGVTGGNYNNMPTCPAAADCSATTVTCTAAQMAASDLCDWQREVSNTLPSGIGTVTLIPGSNPAVFTVTVNWENPGGNLPGSANTPSYSLNIQP
jgi:type IV pilus assembly protein PilV